MIFSPRNKKLWQDWFIGKEPMDPYMAKYWATKIINGQDTIDAPGTGWPYIAELFIIAHETMKEVKETNDQPG